MTPAIPTETWRLREVCLRHLGARCSCPCGCREASPRRLEFHHAQGDGATHRRTVRGLNFYQRLLKQIDAGQPLDPPLQLLCLNCHGEVTRFGGCDGGCSATDAAPTGGLRTAGQHPRQTPGVSESSAPAPRPPLEAIETHVYSVEAYRAQQLPPPPPDPDPAPRRWPWSKR